jgi:hypothetical protein
LMVPWKPLNKPSLFLGTTITIWLVVWNIFCIFPYIGNNHPNWRTPSFFRGVDKYTTNQLCLYQ